MIYYLKLIFAVIFTFSILLKIILIFLFIWGILLLRRYLRMFVMTINDLKIKYMFFYVLNTFLFVFLYVCLLGYWRFLNTHRFLDLKILSYRFHRFYHANSFYDTITLFILIIFLIVFLYYLILFFKKYLFFHFLKMDIFITYLNELEDSFDTTVYEKFQYKLMSFAIIFHTYLIFKPLWFFCQLYHYNEEYHKKSNMEKHDIISNTYMNLRYKLNIPKHEAKVPFYLLFFGIIYDILYNDMVLTKLYYISFILFFYYIIQKINFNIGRLEKSNQLFIYKFLYEKKELDEGWTEEEQQEQILYINKEIKRIDNDKPTYPLDYDEKRLIKLSWSTYLIIITILMLISIIYWRNLEITSYFGILDNNLIILILVIMIVILWFFVNNIIIENIFLLFNSVIIMGWLLIFLNHNVPLLFHETILEISYLKIVDNYTIQEKLLFLKEYFMFKMQYASVNEKLHLLKILKNMPFYDLLQTVTITEIKEYIDNLISLHTKLEDEIYPSLKDKIQEQNRIKVSSDSIFDILFNISLITIIAILFKLR